MKLSDHDLRQMNDDWVDGLPADRLRSALRQTLNDLKEARDRLNMSPANSSRPPGSMAPWDSQSSPSSEVPPDDLPDSQCAHDASKSDTPPDKKKPSEKPSDNGAEPDTASSKQASGKPPGKQLGAPGYGRTQQLPVTEIVPHYPVACAAWTAPLSMVESTRCWTGWDQVDIVPLSDGDTGFKLGCTRHPLFETTCSCGHVT